MNTRFKIIMMALVMMFVSLPDCLSAQGVSLLGENVDYYNNEGSGLFTAESLYMGAPFLRDTTKRFVVSFVAQEAGIPGDLYLVMPDSSEIFIMPNWGVDAGYSVDLTDSIAGKIHHLDTVYFKYDVAYGANPRYSGPNRSPLDTPAWQATDRWVTDDYDGRLCPGNDYPPRHRFCPAGWLNNPVTHARTDTVQFGFEDLPAEESDQDWDDIIFNVTGLFLIRESQLEDIKLTPPDTAMIAGQTLSFFGTVNGFDRQGYRFIMPTDTVNKYLRWAVTSDHPGNLHPATFSNNAGPSSSNSFTATEIGTYIITVTYIQTVQLLAGGTRTDTLHGTRIIHVSPAPANKITIETSATADNYTPRTFANGIQLPVGTSSVTAYAFVRDQYDNLISPAGTTVWTVNNTGIAAITPSTASPSVAVSRGTDITRQKDSTQLIATFGSLPPATVKIIVYNNESFGSIYIAEEPNATSGLLNFTLQGNYTELDNYSLVLYAVGATNLGHFNPVTAIWTAHGYSTLTVGSGSSNTLLLGALPAQQNTPLSRIDTITIDYIDPLSGPKQDQLIITIRDTTDYDTVDVLVIVPDTAYRNASNKNTLYNTYNGITNSTPYGGDTVKLAPLFFDINSGSQKFLGNANVGFQSGQVAWFLNGQQYGTDSVFKYVNAVPGRKDTVVAVYTSGSGVVRDTLYLNWAFGHERILSIESSPGVVSSRGNGSLSTVIFTTSIQTQTVYGVVRDENGYCVTNASLEMWSFQDPTKASAYLKAPPGDSLTSQCYINKLQNPPDSISFVLNAVLSRQNIAGVDAATQTKSIEIRLANYSFDQVGIFADSSNHYDQEQGLTGVINTSGVNYPRSNGRIGANDTLKLTAVDDVIILKGLLRRNDATNRWEENSVTWSISDKSWLVDTVFSVSSKLVLRPTKKTVNTVTLTATYNAGGTMLTTSISIVVEPPRVVGYVMNPVNPAQAGTPITITWTAVDINGNTVTELTRQPDSVCIYLVGGDNPVQVVTTPGDTDVISKGTDKVCGTSMFVNGQMTTTFVSTKMDSLRIMYVINNDDSTVIKNAYIVFTPADPDHIRIVYRDGGVDAVRDTLTSFGSDSLTQRSYLALLYDYYDNPITDAQVSNIGWQSLHSSNLTRAGNAATYNARGGNGDYLDTLYASYMEGSQVRFSDNVIILVLPIVEVKQVVTHDWLPDTLNNPGMVTFVLDSVLGVLDSLNAVSLQNLSRNALYVRELKRYGYGGGSLFEGPVRDGYLDYLDIELSTNILLRSEFVTGIIFDTLVGNKPDSTVWAMSVTLNGRVLRPILQSLSGIGKRYRLWLIPHVFSGSSMETSFLPSICFNNDAIWSANIPHIRIGNAETIYETPSSIVVDSAPPVVDRFIFQNNKCSSDGQLNTVQVVFSEPVRINEGMFRILSALKLVNSTSIDTTFMAVYVNGIIPNYLTFDDWQSWNLKSGSTMVYVLELKPEADALFRTNVTEMCFNSKSGNMQITDLSGNSGCEGLNRKALLESDKTLSALCSVEGPSVVDRYEAMNFSWGHVTEQGEQLDVPLYSYWGFELNLGILGVGGSGSQLMVPVLNCNDYIMMDYASTDLLITADATVFDLLGNVVASSATNKALRVTYTASDLKEFLGMPDVPSCGSIDSSKYDVVPGQNGEKTRLYPKYPLTLSLGYETMVKVKNTGKQVVPMWNCLNGKGRLVAPGGYIVIENINVLGKNMPVITRKLIVTSKSRGQIGL